MVLARLKPKPLTERQKAANRKSWTEAFKWADKEGRKSPVVTCPASRHVRMMAEQLRKRGSYPMLAEEPVHCSESMYVTVGSLWTARHRIAELETEVERLRERVSYMGTVCQSMHEIGVEALKERV